MTAADLTLIRDALQQSYDHPAALAAFARVEAAIEAAEEIGRVERDSEYADVLPLARAQARHALAAALARLNGNTE